MALSAGAGGALAGLGNALMRRSDIARENELMTRQEARQDALLTRQEKREDLNAARMEALALAREERERTARTAERAEDRRFQQGLADQQAGLTREQMRQQAKLAGDENELMGRRLDDQDRRSVEDAATTQLAALDKRIIELQDMLLKGEVLGTEGEVERQIAAAEDQKLEIRGRLVDRLYEMGDPRYKDMPADQRMYAAGYSKDQVARFMRLAEGTGGEGAAPESPEAPARSDAQIGQDLMAAESRTGRSGGLSPGDRAALGLPEQGGAPAAMAAGTGVPESPPPLRDMSQAGRGRRLLSPPPGGGGRTPLQARREREAAAEAAKQPKQAELVQQSIEALLKPYGGDAAKAPAHVKQVIEILSKQLETP